MNVYFRLTLPEFQAVEPCLGQACHLGRRIPTTSGSLPVVQRSEGINRHRNIWIVVKSAFGFENSLIQIYELTDVSRKTGEGYGEQVQSGEIFQADVVRYFPGSTDVTAMDMKIE